MGRSSALLAAAGFSSLVAAQVNGNDGFQRTPVMGYNTYNAASCNVNETWIEDTIEQFNRLGFQALGYKYWQMDCGWASDTRQSNGSIGWDTGRFPNGIEPLSQTARNNGFEWSMYTDEGVYACDTGTQRSGSEGYETQDAAQFAGWNVAYMKVDNCWITANSDAPHNANSDFVSRYSKMSDALIDVGIKGMLVCQWGVPYINPQNELEGPAEWTPQLATSFRVSDDISDEWDSVNRIVNEAINVNLRGLNGPGHFADMDLLEVGNPGLTDAQQATHFSLWCLFKSALMVSTNLNTLSDTAKALLQNQALIDINQDSLGKPVILRERYTNDNDQYYGPLANGDLAVALVDQSGTSRSLTLNLYQYNISTADVTNVLTGEVANGVTSYTVNVDPNGSLVARLSNIVYSNPTPPTYTYISGPSGTLSGGAVVQSCAGCAGGQNVGYLGGGSDSTSGSVTFSGITTSQGNQDILVNYVNCDVGFLESGPYANTRGATFSVNGGSPQQVLFPLTGYDWTADTLTIPVHLYGFNTNGENTIVMTGYQGTTEYAPNLVGISVVA